MSNMFEHYQRGTSFANWVERLGYFFEATDVTDPEMQKAHLITLLDSTVFSELKVLCSNKDLKLVTFEEIVQRLKDRYDKKECGMIQRYKFHNRVQLPNETAQEFIDVVKLQAELCNFGNFKQTAIVDQIVIGIRDKVLQRRLLCEEEITLELTEKIVATWELTGSNRVDGRSVKERLGVVRVGERMADYEEPIKASKAKRAKNCANLTCGFCGKLGHARKRCFELKALSDQAMMDVHYGLRTPKRTATITATANVSEDEADETYYWKRTRCLRSK